LESQHSTGTLLPVAVAANSVHFPPQTGSSDRVMNRRGLRGRGA